MKKFLKGMDISSLPEHMDAKEIFYDQNGEAKEPFKLLKDNGVNSIRLRIWNEPGLVPESKGYCDLPHTIEMAEQIKANDMHFVLDFHYSDFWADPGQQKKPHAWSGTIPFSFIRFLATFRFIALSSTTRILASGA